MRIDVVTIFPDFFRGAFEYGIIRRARAAELVDIKVHDLQPVKDVKGGGGVTSKSKSITGTTGIH